ncbi:arsenate reductase/protein-tyrosine-phosphatase family protein [Thiohalomonas denitrificans]|uniref:arsenate reductase/protein-tyrosine-phosphatase family protein n=1 Tax=Thiohalomonas denitrificans TaxID=415747 RepID=UPI0026F05F3D|nr:hypothetical protein [Thiohalomonas denitrificans]
MSHFTQVDFHTVRRVVFVCKGNICRSAYAHARARQLGLYTDSFGLEADALHADADAIQNATARQLDLSAHTPKAPHQLRLTETDLLAAMEPQQCLQLEKQYPNAQITLLGLWASPRRPYIHDPYGHGSRYFQACFSTIDSAVDCIAKNLIEAER